MRSVKEIKAPLRAVRADMKRCGIKRTSCFNGGLDRQVYAFNAKCFALETELKDAQKAAAFVDVSNIQEYGLTQKLSNSIRVF